MTTTLKLFSCIVFALFLSGCVGGGGGGSGSAASLDGSASSYMAWAPDEGPLFEGGMDMMSFSTMMLVEGPEEATDPRETVPNPEPATMALFGMGLGGMALLRRKRV